jgi:hypothetical protein
MPDSRSFSWFISVPSMSEDTNILVGSKFFSKLDLLAFIECRLSLLILFIIFYAVVTGKLRWRTIKIPTLLFLLVSLDFMNSIGLPLDWLIQVLLFKEFWNVPWVTLFCVNVLFLLMTFWSEEHIVRLENVFQRLSSHGLNLKWSKC